MRGGIKTESWALAVAVGEIDDVTRMNRELGGHRRSVHLSVDSFPSVTVSVLPLVQGPAKLLATWNINIADPCTCSFLLDARM